MLANLKRDVIQCWFWKKRIIYLWYFEIVAHGERRPERTIAAVPLTRLPLLAGLALVAER